MLGVASRSELQITVERVSLAGIRTALFYEPDDNLGPTATCTQPVAGPIRRIFRRLALWAERVIDARGRDPPHPDSHVRYQNELYRILNDEE